MIKALTVYLRGVWEELKKVVWPSRQEIIQHTLVVIGLSLFLAVFLGAVDFLLNLGLEKLLFSK